MVEENTTNKVLQRNKEKKRLIDIGHIYKSSGIRMNRNKSDLVSVRSVRSYNNTRSERVIIEKLLGENAKNYEQNLRSLEWDAGPSSFNASRPRHFDNPSRRFTSNHPRETRGFIRT